MMFYFWVSLRNDLRLSSFSEDRFSASFQRVTLICDEKRKEDEPQRLEDRRGWGILGSREAAEARRKTRDGVFSARGPNL
jgi:hypothetical protein